MSKCLLCTQAVASPWAWILDIRIIIWNDSCLHPEILKLQTLIMLCEIVSCSCWCNRKWKDKKWRQNQTCLKLKHNSIAWLGIKLEIPDAWILNLTCWHTEKLKFIQLNCYLHATIFHGFVEKKKKIRHKVEIGKISLARVICVQNPSFKEKSIIQRKTPVCSNIYSFLLKWNLPKLQSTNCGDLASVKRTWGVVFSVSQHVGWPIL